MWLKREKELSEKTWKSYQPLHLCLYQPHKLPCKIKSEIQCWVSWPVHQYGFWLKTIWSLKSEVLNCYIKNNNNLKLNLVKTSLYPKRSLKIFKVCFQKHSIISYRSYHLPRSWKMVTRTPQRSRHLGICRVVEEYSRYLRILKIFLSRISRAH